MKNKSYCASLVLLSSASVQAASGLYSVKPGDNLNLILDRFIDYRVGPKKSALYQEVLKYNQFIKNPDLIYPKQSLILPSLKSVTYKVKAGDTLSQIVKDHKHLAVHMKFKEQLKRTIAANPQITDPNIIEIGQVIHMGSALEDVPAKNYAFYKVKKGDSFAKLLNRFYTGIDITQALKHVKRTNPEIKNLNKIKPKQTIKLPAKVQGQNLIDRYVERVVASVKRIEPRYFYPDELGFEVKKMDNEEASEYISQFQKLTKSDSPKKWKEVFNEIMEISQNENHENIRRAFYLYAIDIEEDGNIQRVRGEVKEFLKVWKEARKKRFKL